MLVRENISSLESFWSRFTVEQCVLLQRGDSSLTMPQFQEMPMINLFERPGRRNWSKLMLQSGKLFTFVISNCMIFQSFFWDLLYLPSITPRRYSSFLRSGNHIMMPEIHLISEAQTLFSRVWKIASIEDFLAWRLFLLHWYHWEKEACGVCLPTMFGHEYAISVWGNFT